MDLDPDACHRALRARDGRFDGVFYVGVTTTGVYCRPICPARTPGRDRCSFFGSAAEAEHSGFRACLRCRPELAPGHARVDSIPRLVRTAADRIEAGFLDEHSVDALATSLDVTARHLRRAMEQQLGVSPIELAQTRRLARAKQLLHDTALPIATVAHASGFGSVRRFNAAFRRRFDRAPSSLRRRKDASRREDTIDVQLSARAPWDGRALLEFLAGRAIPGVEEVDAERYQRSVALGSLRGRISIQLLPQQSKAWLRVTLGLAPRLAQIVARVRRLLDLDARPDVIDAHLRTDPVLRDSLARHPGLRVPGAFDGFEVAVRTVLGQQVTVRGASTLTGRLVERFGEAIDPSSDPPPSGPSHYWPPAEVLANASSSAVAAIGLPKRRAQTIVALAQAVIDQRVVLETSADPGETMAALCELPGIGPWSAHYIAMRVLEWPDAFPASDLGIRKGLEVTTPREAEAHAARWAPWRAYGVMHLWSR